MYPCPQRLTVMARMSSAGSNPPPPRMRPSSRRISSSIVSKEVAENAAKLWKSKQPFKWVQIKGAGHNIRREQFEEYKNTLTGFLQLISA